MTLGSSVATTSSSCSTDMGSHLQVATSVSICIILVVGPLLNGLALWVFSRRLHKWTEARIYMVNLVATNCLLLLGLLGALLMLGRGDVWCRVAQSFFHVNTYMSVGLVTAMAVDRYAALCLPPRARGWRCPRQAAVTCGALWLLVTGVVVLSAFWLREWKIFCFGQCGQMSNPRTLMFSLLLFFLLLPVLTFCSVQVLGHLLREWKRAPPQSVGSTHKAFCVVVANLATFLLCFLPLHGALLAKLVAQWMDASYPTLQRVTSWVQATSLIAQFNCCLCGFGYYFVASELQEETVPILSLPWPFRGWSLSMTGVGTSGELDSSRLSSSGCVPSLP